MYYLPGGVIVQQGAWQQLRPRLASDMDEALRDVGEGIQVATVRDPFGNVFGIIENPHFDRDKVG